MFLNFINPEEFWKIMDEKLENMSTERMANPKKWLRSGDVKEMLGISDSTLQTMRINGSIPAYKLDKTWFYKYEEIMEALEKGKVEGGKHE